MGGRVFIPFLTFSAYLVGTIFAFIVNFIVSVTFDFIGFLLTSMLATTHAAKSGARCGLGAIMIRYGIVGMSHTHRRYGHSQGGGVLDWILLIFVYTHSFFNARIGWINVFACPDRVLSRLSFKADYSGKRGTSDCGLIVAHADPSISVSKYDTFLHNFQGVPTLSIYYQSLSKEFIFMWKVNTVPLYLPYSQYIHSIHFAYARLG